MPAFHARPGPRSGRGSASVRVPGFTLTPGRHLRGSALGWHDHEVHLLATNRGHELTAASA